MNSFGQRLKALRKEAGVSQAFLAEHIGISVQSVSNWECDNTMPDISQIIPLAALLSVSTDCLLGVGINESRDKEELNAEINRIWTNFSVNSAENNADMLVYEKYRQYLTRYPLDYEVKYKCALAVNDYLTVSAERKKFDLPEEKREKLSAESARLLHSVCDNCTDAQLQIDAQKALISLLTLKKQWPEAEKAALSLPEICGIRAELTAEVARKKGDLSAARKYLEIACRLKLTDYVRSLFYRAKSLSDDPGTAKETAAAAWKEMQEAAEQLVGSYPSLSDLAVNAFEKNPYCFLITSFTACSNFLLDHGDLPGALDCAEKAADAAVGMVGRAKETVTDPLILSDLLFFAEHTPGWCCRWAAPENSDAMIRDEEYRKLAEKVRDCVGE